MKLSQKYKLVDKLRIKILILQDRDDLLKKTLDPFVADISVNAEVKVLSIHNKKILPCIACDVCPPRIGPDENYRCIRAESDDFHCLHGEFLDSDVIIPAVLSTRNRTGLMSAYQNFMERTRYLRRGDYAISDRLIVPFILCEIGAYENLHMRVTTSLIRHHTVLQKPIIAWSSEGNLLNKEEIDLGLKNCIRFGSKLVAGRLAMTSEKDPVALYKPVGYVLSVAGNKTSLSLQKRKEIVSMRYKKMQQERLKRLDRR